MNSYLVTNRVGDIWDFKSGAVLTGYLVWFTEPLVSILLSICTPRVTVVTPGLHFKGRRNLSSPCISLFTNRNNRCCPELYQSVTLHFVTIVISINIRNNTNKLT